MHLVLNFEGPSKYSVLKSEIVKKSKKKYVALVIRDSCALVDALGSAVQKLSVNDYLPHVVVGRSE